MVQIPRLREWRELQGWTQKDLARESGVSPRSIAGYEAGASARPSTARKLAEALGVEVADLVLTSGKVSTPPSPEQPPLNGFEEKRRLSIPTQAIVTVADRWAERARTNPEKAPGLAEAAEDLEELFSVVLGDEELWQSLSTNERAEIAAALSRLGTVSETYHTERAEEEREELRRRWMRQMNLRKKSA